ncbi:MAG TPA: hypothetical protein V6C97_06155 [Oculatellaceae cyanobacterium]
MWQRACENDAAAEFALGQLFASDHQCLENDPQYAVRFFVSADEHGHAGAAFRLAQIYLNCDNMPLAVQYAKKAADLGESRAQVFVSYVFECSGNAPEALWYLMLAADQHVAVAEQHLAECYQFGMLGLQQSLPRALKYFKLAQRHGSGSGAAAAAAAQIQILTRQGVVAEP